MKPPALPVWMSSSLSARARAVAPAGKTPLTLISPSVRTWIQVSAWNEISIVTPFQTSSAAGGGSVVGAGGLAAGSEAFSVCDCGTGAGTGSVFWAGGSASRAANVPGAC